MINIKLNSLEGYLSSVYNAKARILFLCELNEKIEKSHKEKLKTFGYGSPYLIEFTVNGGETKRVILETVRPGGFGHDHFSDRALINYGSIQRSIFSQTRSLN
jgi:hypothetical protein